MFDENKVLDTCPSSDTHISVRIGQSPKKCLSSICPRLQRELLGVISSGSLFNGNISVHVFIIILLKMRFSWAKQLFFFTLPPHSSAQICRQCQRSGTWLQLLGSHFFLRKDTSPCSISAVHYRWNLLLKVLEQGKPWNSKYLFCETTSILSPLSPDFNLRWSTSVPEEHDLWLLEVHSQIPYIGVVSQSCRRSLLSHSSTTSSANRGWV